MLLPVVSRFLQWFVVGIVSPVLNLLILARGNQVDGLGLVWTIYAVVIVVLELPTGILADLIGRKRTFLASLLASAAAYAALLPARGLLAVTIAVCLMALARSLSSGSIEALFIDRFIAERGEGRLHELASAFGVAEAAGLALGALIGGYVPLLWTRLAPGADRYSGNLFLMLAVVLTHGVLIAFLVKGDGRDRDAPPPRLGSFLRDSLAFVRGAPVFRLFLLGTLAWGLCFQPIELFWQPRLEAILGSAEKTWIFGLLSSGYFLAGMLGSAAAPLLLRKRPGAGYPMIAALRILNGLFILALAGQNGLGGFAFFYLSMFVFNGMANPPEAAALNREIPSERRASMLSLVSLALQAGGGIGSLAFGLLARRVSIPAAWLGAGSILALSSLVYLAAGRKVSRREAAGSGPGGSAGSAG